MSNLGIPNGAISNIYCNQFKSNLGIPNGGVSNKYCDQLKSSLVYQKLQLIIYIINATAIKPVNHILVHLSCY
jgi:hypothetical protein